MFPSHLCCKSGKILLRSTVKETLGHVADNVLLIKDLNWDPDYYRVNLIHTSSIDSHNYIHDPTDLGDRSLCYIFRCGSRSCKFPNKFV